MAGLVDWFANYELLQLMTSSGFMAVRPAPFPIFGLAVQPRSARSGAVGAALIRQRLPCYHMH